MDGWLFGLAWLAFWLCFVLFRWFSWFVWSVGWLIGDWLDRH
jgi:hypothetical protein